MSVIPLWLTKEECEAGQLPDAIKTAAAAICWADHRMILSSP